ncbi:hypothetical protein [Fulvivirga ligni]|uniref:hypothetical protein n=1 Tax=Fulvivirga ligni TaxID=2904246 RepID=UPI001F2FE1E7|nr:hypothetical protein [Fulvivirga ligni]UII24273.1 hypothetical protein LVD16_13710 [Fulvivirga ligni]
MIRAYLLLICILTTFQQNDISGTYSSQGKLNTIGGIMRSRNTLHLKPDSTFQYQINLFTRSTVEVDKTIYSGMWSVNTDTLKLKFTTVNQTAYDGEMNLLLLNRSRLEVIGSDEKLVLRRVIN